MIFMYLKRLKSIRIEAGLKQEDVALILNLKRTTYTSFELGRDTIPLDKLLAFAKYFNCSIDYLFEFTEKRNYNKSRYDIDISIISKRLKESRIESQYSQENIANILNTNHSVWSRYEHGKYLIKTSFLYAYAKELFLSADYLLGLIDKPKYLK